MSPAPGRPRSPRRRDRHGRGLRGPLAPSHVPIAKSRSERFDDLVLDAVDRLKPRWAKQLAAVEFAVEEVPPVSELGDGPGLLTGEPIPFGRAEPADGSHPAVVIIYRRPLESRSRDRDHLGAMVHEAVVEQVAGLLGLSPESIDPGFDDHD
ncbi:metallopeptidase family protein [Streptosporangium sp. NBC_01755]|uniref:metallopeptidase family protein n=1 Tax=unclassified Streptosporangium TaxID=2632669 RepID=UPI002DD8EC54|nr:MULTISPECIES: metallopeptidase family protein [unclassified Streptosporangium]WSA24114.1 metallopeptidase family protein [Streptosporangium sp. NBC_01810]WSC97814.1 metallopeptidase family protein [Streptosporangium sp. NBC_01755]